jgi:hypothetical protein
MHFFDENVQLFTNLHPICIFLFLKCINDTKREEKRTLKMKESTRTPLNLQTKCNYYLLPNLKKRPDEAEK